jgi:hypothetical protein
MSDALADDLVDRAWRDALAWLPADTDSLAFETGALVRRRQIRTGAQLLRLSLAFAVHDLTLRGTAAWAATHNLAHLSDVAVYKRLAAAAPFLAAVLARLLSSRITPPAFLPDPAPPTTLPDVAFVELPGGAARAWRLQLGYDATAGAVSAVDLREGPIPAEGEVDGVVKGTLLVGGRAHASVAAIAAAAGVGAHVLVPVGRSTVPVWEADTRLDPLRVARTMPRGVARVTEAGGVVVGADGTRVPVRLLVVRKSLAARRRRVDSIWDNAERTGKLPRASALAAAGFTFLLTTLPAAEADGVVLADLYRVRWQLEAVGRRLVRRLPDDVPRAKEEGLARTYVLGKLVAAALADTLARSARALAPWGLPLPTAARS